LSSLNKNKIIIKSTTQNLVNILLDISQTSKYCTIIATWLSSAQDLFGGKVAIGEQLHVLPRSERIQVD
jgi:hypothetical protein